MQQSTSAWRDAGARERQRSRLVRRDVEQVAAADAVMLHRLGAAEDDHRRLRAGRAPRSSEVSTTAPPPSEMMQQSSRCSGDEITRDASTSSTVIGSRYLACGFMAACRRMVTAISASCSLVVPYSCMCRCATSAYEPTMVGPNGRLEVIGRIAQPAAARADREALGRRRRAVGDQRHLAQSRRDRRRRVQAVRHERRAADGLRVEVARPQVQVLRQRQDADGPDAAGEEPVDVADRRARRRPARRARSRRGSGTRSCRARSASDARTRPRRPPAPHTLIAQRLREVGEQLVERSRLLERRLVPRRCDHLEPRAGDAAAPAPRRARRGVSASSAPATTSVGTRSAAAAGGRRTPGRRAGRSGARADRSSPAPSRPRASRPCRWTARSVSVPNCCGRRPRATSRVRRDQLRREARSGAAVHARTSPRRRRRARAATTSATAPPMLRPTRTHGRRVTRLEERARPAPRTPRSTPGRRRRSSVRARAGRAPRTLCRPASPSSCRRHMPALLPAACSRTKSAPRSSAGGTSGNVVGPVCR